MSIQIKITAVLINKNHLPMESFAEFSECTVAGHTDLIKQYFPKSYAAYENMLNDATKL